jgi:hypothetical protein
MQIKSQSSVSRSDQSAQDAARYGQRLAEIGRHLATLPGEDTAKARELLKQAADAALEASRLMEGAKPQKLRLHVNFANQPELLAEAARYLLERSPGDSPVTVHRGVGQEHLPFGVQPTARLVLQLRALLGDDSVWTEMRK